MKKGVIYIVISGLSFLVVNLIVKILGNPSYFPDLHLQKYPAQELVLARSIVSFSISAFIIYRKKLPFFGNNKKWLLMRGTFGMIALTLFFFTIEKLPLAIASTLQYLSPIFTIFIASFLFKEKISKTSYIASTIALLGVFFIGWNSINKDAQFSFEWILIAIVSAFFSGIAYNSIKKLKETDEAINIVIYFPMLALPITGVWTFFDGVMPQGIEWLLLLTIGIFTQIAQICMTRAFLLVKTSTIAPFQYLGAVYSLILGWFIFDEKLRFYSLIGIFLIIGGIILELYLSTINTKSKK